MTKRSIPFFGTLYLIVGIAGLASATPYQDCIKDCEKKRTDDINACLAKYNSALTGPEGCAEKRKACLDAAKKETEKRACKTADKECKSKANEEKKACDKAANDAAKACKEKCKEDRPQSSSPRAREPSPTRTLQQAPGTQEHPQEHPR